jgi:hypothetical protein
LILLGSSWLRIIWTRRGINAVQHQNIVFHGLLKHIPWATADRLVEQYNADPDDRGLKTKAHLIAMLYAQFCGARGLREIETGLRSHASKLYHLGGCTVSKSALSTANASRPVEVFAGLLSALMDQLHRGFRRKIKDCVRLIDSTSVQLSSLSGDWATFSAGVFGAKAHIIYDPDADQPLYLMVTASNVNDITAAKAMPIEREQPMFSTSATTITAGGRPSIRPVAASSRASRPTRPSRWSRIGRFRRDRLSLAIGSDTFPSGLPRPGTIRCRA